MSPSTLAWLSALALVVGALIPVQAVMNAALARTIGSVFYASLSLFVVALSYVAIALIVQRQPLPALASLRAAPPWSYLGGLIVGSYVLSITYLAPRLGVGPAICFIVTGQILAAVLIDHFGLFGAIVRPMDLSRTAGVALMIVGLFLARR